MPVYSYRVLSENGQTLTGERISASASELSRELAGRGLLVDAIRKKRQAAWPFRNWRAHEDNFALFNHEFTALIRAGLTIPDALEVAAERWDAPRFSLILKRVLEDVRGGMRLSEACANYPEAFSPLYVSTLKTGEGTGDLQLVLMRYQEILKQQLSIRKKISQAMAYPVFLVLTLIIIMGILFLFVMPRFVSVYADFDAELPLPTKILLELVENIHWYGLAGGTLIVAAWLGFKLWSGSASGRLWIGTIKERLPVFGQIHRTNSVLQLAATLSTLLQAGTPLVPAMRAAEESIQNDAFAQRVARATQRVVDGQSLAHALLVEHVVPATAIKLIEVGEASGSLDQMLGEVALFYREVLENRLARAMVLVEPALMLLIGIVVGSIILIMYLPIFYVAEIVK